MSWVQNLSRLDLDAAERAEMGRVLKVSVAALRPHRESDLSKVQGSGDICEAIQWCSTARVPSAPKGYLWQGRAPQCVLNALPALRAEAEQERCFARHATKHTILESVGAAQQLHKDPEFLSFIREVSGLNATPSSAFYHWYENTSDFCEPHVDTDEFSLSFLMLLNHRRPNDVSHCSSFFICPPGTDLAEVPLEEGDALVFYAGNVVHARSAPSPGELVTSISFGFGWEGPQS